MGDEKVRLNVLFGSDSDEKKVLPGIEKITAETSWLEVRVHYASADNTPEKVVAIMEELKKQEGRKPYVSGAGMSNVLTGVVKTYANVEDLVIGIPIADSKTGGLSSFLSTGEKPPRNPVLMVGLNNSYAALNIAAKFLRGIGICDQKPVVLEDEQYKPQTGDLQVNKVREALDKLGMIYVTKALSDVDPNDVVVTAFDPRQTDGPLQRVDERLEKGLGVQVGIPNELPMYAKEYANCLRETKTTGIVGFGRYENAAIVVAQLLEDKNALSQIKQQKAEKAQKLGSHPGLLVSGGEAKPYEV